MKASTLVAALALLGGASANSHKKPQSLKATKVQRSAKKDLNRLAGFAAHAEAHNQKKIDFLDYSSTAEVAANYGVVSMYDFTVDLGVKGIDGESFSSLPVIMDTGSSNLAVAVEGCTNCEKGASDLEIKLHETGGERCMEVTYGSGSWGGVEAADNTTIRLGEITATAPDALTAITIQDDFFDGGYSGIFGLAYPSLAMSYDTCAWTSSVSERERFSAKTLLQAWKEAGTIDSNLFQITYYEEAATLTIGEVDSSLHTGSMTYVEMRKLYGEYYGYCLVKVGSVGMDGDDFDLDGADVNAYGGVLVDSGTTLLYLPSKIVEQLKEKLMAASSLMTTEFFDWDTAISTAEAEAADLPDLHITLEGSSANYTMTLDWMKYTYNYGGKLYWGVSTSSLGIIGNIAQMDKSIVFDLDSNMMGFAESASTSSSEELASESEEPVTVRLYDAASHAPMVAGGVLVAAALALVAAAKLRRRPTYYPVA